MGYFTWYFADKRGKLRYDGIGYIALPDGTFIKENSYFGYGIFGTTDAYDVVAILNRPYLKDILRDIKARKGEIFGEKYIVPVAEAYQYHGEDAAQKEADEMVQKGMTGNYFSKDWKRNIGIAIACDDDNNAALPYPLKITSTDHPGKPYEKLRPSRSTQ